MTHVFFGRKHGKVRVYHTMTSKFCKFLFGLHRKSDERSMKNYIVLSLVIFSLSKIVILNGLLKSPNMYEGTISYEQGV